MIICNCLPPLSSAPTARKIEVVFFFYLAASAPNKKRKPHFGVFRFWQFFVEQLESGFVNGGFVHLFLFGSRLYITNKNFISIVENFGFYPNKG